MKLILDKESVRLLLNSVKSSISNMETDFRHEEDIAKLKMIKHQLEAVLNI